MEILLAIALGALLRDPVVTYVDPSYKPSSAEKDKHESAVKKVAKGTYPKAKKAGAAAGRGAAAGTAATVAFMAALGHGAKDRWKSRKRPERKVPETPAPPDEPRPAPPPTVPDTFRPAPQIVFVPMPPTAPPTVPKPEAERPLPPRPEHSPTIPEQPGPDEGKPRLKLVKDDADGGPDKPEKAEAEAPEKDVAKTGDAPPSGDTPPLAPQEGRTPVASEVHFNQLVGFLLESTQRTRDDAAIARFVQEDDLRIANALDNMANQARALKAGEKAATAISALREKVAQQAATADEYSKRCDNVAEKAATADRNIRTRYDGMARSAAEMSEGPAYSSYYEGA